MPFLVTEAILTGLFLYNFETTKCKNLFDTNLVKILSEVIEILSFSSFVLFLVMADGGNSECETAKEKKIEMASCKKSLAQSWANVIKGS